MAVRPRGIHWKTAWIGWGAGKDNFHRTTSKERCHSRETVYRLQGQADSAVEVDIEGEVRGENG